MRYSARQPLSAAFEEKYGFDVRVKYADGYMQSYHAMRNNIPCDSPMTSDGESLTYRERKASLYCGKYVTLMGGKKEIEILFPHYCETKMLKIGVVFQTPQFFRRNRIPSQSRSIFLRLGQ